MSPNDCELYLKGHIEVPNMLGSDCNCETEGFSDFSGIGGQMTYGGQVAGNVGLPPDAIVPGATPTVVGDGVIISAPAQ